MTGSAITIAVLAILVAMFLLGFSALGWLSWISGEQLTPAQEAFAQAADWTIKASLGAIAGFIGGTGLARRNGNKER